MPSHCMGRRLIIACALATLATAAGAEDGYFVYVGSYTDSPSTSKSIYGWRFDPSSGCVALGGSWLKPSIRHMSPLLEDPRRGER